MEKAFIDSEAAFAVKYFEADKVLRIWYTSGGVYEYSDVPLEEYDRLMNAESKGQYINFVIKEKYDYKDVKGRI